MNKALEDTIHVSLEEDDREVEEDEQEDEKGQADEVSCQASVVRVLPPELQAMSHVVKQIQEFSMTMEEGIMAAVKTGDVQWLVKLEEDDSYMLNVYGAAVVGAENGDVDLVRCLLELVDDREDRNDLEWDILGVAAEHGHSSVFELVYSVETIDPYILGYFAKDREALDNAIRVDNKPLMERLYRAYPGFVQGDWYERNAPTSMLGEAAQEGHLNAVKYLIERGHDSLEEENRAFIRAARGNCVETMVFFRDRGRISVETSNKAFELAAYFGSTEAVKFLHEKESISPESIAAGFELAASNVSYCYRGQRVKK
ncbi:hypothetical protein PHYSODRAFT_332336 [Phytophthora sojae]|uniref:Uncharacterized protein n=1 Tax=Phytophthora sojae (strain P6497) TaxID=1094619 RepID=G4ZGD7_PHYSP|nr:hypothetical protein PHYSODRAFT_332336 [Phytophthora sojae]EGZ18582.1 hypothetical protein PHYSODRAFT_332336 [Phytophthora sojae]|eukprot:XP_009527640.1 hypothetical protein PHYSODRAFT_332336 [Phytophthora sojae]